MLFDALVAAGRRAAVTRCRQHRPGARVRQGPVPPLQADPGAGRARRAARARRRASSLPTGKADPGLLRFRRTMSRAPSGLGPGTHEAPALRAGNRSAGRLATDCVSPTPRAPRAGERGSLRVRASVFWEVARSREASPIWRNNNGRREFRLRRAAKRERVLTKPLLRRCSAFAASIAVFTSSFSSGGGSTAFIPSDCSQSSRHQPRL